MWARLGKDMCLSEVTVTLRRTFLYLRLSQKRAGKTATMLPMEIHFCKKDLEMKFTEMFVADKNK